MPPLRPGGVAVAGRAADRRVCRRDRRVACGLGLAHQSRRIRVGSRVVSFLQRARLTRLIRVGVLYSVRSAFVAKYGTHWPKEANFGVQV